MTTQDLQHLRITYLFLNPVSPDNVCVSEDRVQPPSARRTGTWSSITTCTLSCWRYLLSQAENFLMLGVMKRQKARDGAGSSAASAWLVFWSWRFSRCSYNIQAGCFGSCLWQPVALVSRRSRPQAPHRSTPGRALNPPQLPVMRRSDRITPIAIPATANNRTKNAMRIVSISISIVPQRRGS